MLNGLMKVDGVEDFDPVIRMDKCITASCRALIRKATLPLQINPYTHL